MEIIVIVNLIPINIKIMTAIYDKAFGNNVGSSIMMSSLLNIGIYFSSLFNFIGVIIKWIIISSLLYLCIYALDLNYRVQYISIVKIVISAEIVYISAQALVIILLYVKGINTLTSFEDTNIIPSLSNVFKTSNDFVRSLLLKVNLFSILYLLLLTAGIQIMTLMHKLSAFICVFIAWLFWIGIETDIPVIQKLIFNFLWH